ncbi:hypothetical protein [Caldilinea sp.]|jgi:hypothetical protein|uniref:hypothetical protein n=1 Tax=Caldilinea sp. TaxID=2293560 RepID=UPI0021DBAC2A|nr:hypothetical protein [Caldilinea sp.]GIV69280.1 MAG: hypothetical protein KatS3mg048_2142 [Caldilinea sp.]
MNIARRPFAATLQAVLVAWMLISIVLIGQQVSMRLYQIGLVSLVLSALSQIAVGNIPPTANFRRSALLYLWFVSLIVLIFAISIALAPWLASLGR